MSISPSVRSTDLLQPFLDWKIEVQRAEVTYGGATGLISGELELESVSLSRPFPILL